MHSCRWISHRTINPQQREPLSVSDKDRRQMVTQSLTPCLVKTLVLITLKIRPA
ncbi:hypothetical protein Bpfe_021734, partial [Biomphalaria pfeifferi]